MVKHAYYGGFYKILYANVARVIAFSLLARSHTAMIKWWTTGHAWPADWLLNFLKYRNHRPTHDFSSTSLLSLPLLSRWWPFLWSVFKFINIFWSFGLFIEPSGCGDLNSRAIYDKSFLISWFFFILLYYSQEKNIFCLEYIYIFFK